MNLFRSTPSNPNDEDRKHEVLLDQTLLTIPKTKTQITWADAVEGTLITGSTGSGKSSGPARHMALSMLNAGFGMCVFCVKPDEAKRWRKYAEAANRTNDLIVFNHKSQLQFNFLEYEMTRTGSGAGEIVNIINILMNLKEQSAIHQSGGNGKSEDRFWDDSLRRIISRTITLLRLAGEEISINNMRKIVSGHLRGEDFVLYNHLIQKLETTEAIDAQERNATQEDLNQWILSSYFLSTIYKVKTSTFNTHIDREEAETALHYWLKEFPNLSEKPASIITESFMGIVELFINRGILKTHFSEGLSEALRPENIFTQNKIVVIDFSIKEFGLAGVYASTIYKTTFQAAMERRDVDSETNPKPCGLWIDEYHSLCSPMSDSIFQSTARSSWIASVYITQSIQNLYFVMGNSMPRARAKSLLGNLNLKFFCSNSDAENNEWASNMIGKHMTYVKNAQFNKDMEISKSMSQQLQFRLSPDYFTTLRAGRKSNNFMVGTVVFKAGKLWNKNNYALVEFSQKDKSINMTN